MKEMSSREQALFMYFGTVATDPKVQNSKNVNELFQGIMACVQEDLPAVAARIGVGLIDVAKRRVQAHVAQRFQEVAQPGINMAISSVFDSLGVVLGQTVAAKTAAKNKSRGK
jgi:hypothetical protein